MLLRNPFADNLKNIPGLKRARGCVCKLDLGSVLHNGDCVMSHLINENLIYRPGTIVIDRIRPHERGAYRMTASTPCPKTRNAGGSRRRIKHELTRKRARLEAVHLYKRLRLCRSRGEKQVRPEPLGTRYGCHIAGRWGFLGNSFANVS